MIPDTDTLATGILERDRGLLSRAITLVESSREDHFQRAQALLGEVLPRTGKAIRLGISGVPGVGKSSLIETLGLKLIEAGHRVAVLAIDPTSQRSGGSILGDKTRMPRLALQDDAYVRPSPTRGELGGVTRVTRESILLCEAAGFDVILVETVGVGQSETVVADMVDCYLVLMLPGGGDELQGIKKGVLEIADIIAVNKADGDRMAAARQARLEYERALSILQPTSHWKPQALTLSVQDDRGIDDLWQLVRRHRREAIDSGDFVERRTTQRLRWLWSSVEYGLKKRLEQSDAVKAERQAIESAVLDQSMPVSAAAERILDALVRS